MKCVFIIHGWEDTPKSNWYWWLKTELEKKKIRAEVPQMPNTNYPKISEWVPFLKSEVGKPDADTYLVGHSMGCQAILRYLSEMKDGDKVGGVLLIAGFIKLRKEVISGPVSKDIIEMFRPWLETGIDLENARLHAVKIVSVFSDNDPYVPVENAGIFESTLGSKVIIIPRAGHFSIAHGGYKELHLALNELLKMLQD